MSRSIDERIADVRRLLRAAETVYARRGLLAADLARATGLTPEGVELGFASLEREATDDALRALVVAAGDVRSVHVLLSANVFVAPLRALAVARAAASRVSVRPSPRDPVLTRALVEAAGDDAISVVDERDVASIETDEIHVYGRSETIAAVKSRARARVRGHGPGMGVAIVTSAVELDAAADALAADVVPFDQRGCLSPRLALVEIGGEREGETGARGQRGERGEMGEERAVALATALNERLTAWGRRVPRGDLSSGERAEGSRWSDALRFAGRLWAGDDHAVGLLPGGAQLVIPPSGRHVLVVPVEGTKGAIACLAPVAQAVVAIGSDDFSRAAAMAPPHARLSTLGRMQRPPLDGPVDRRE